MSYHARQTPAYGGSMVIDFAKPPAFHTGDRAGAWGPEPETPWIDLIGVARVENRKHHADTQHPAKTIHLPGPGHASAKPDADAAPDARTSLYVEEAAQHAELLELGLEPSLVRSLFVREYSDAEPYSPGHHDGNLRTHVGQDKLLVCEVMCVALQMMRYKKANPDIPLHRLSDHTVVLCLGSASGNPHHSHFHKLVALFPGVHWVMYDPNPMGDIGEAPNVHVYQYAFGELEMNWWSGFANNNPGVNLIMLSDVRSDVYVQHLKMRRATIWRLLNSMRDLQKMEKNSSSASVGSERGQRMLQLEEMLMAAVEEEQEASNSNSSRIRADNRWQNLVLTAINVSAGLLKYVTEWQGSEERARMGHHAVDRILHGALWYQPAAAPSSTELRHSIVRHEQPVFADTDRGGVPYSQTSVSARMPAYSQSVRFSERGPRGQHYGPNLATIVDTCATDDEHKFADLVDTVVVDEIQIEKQCFCANKYVKNQTDVVDVCRAVLRRFQTEFKQEHSPLQLQGVTVARPVEEPARRRRNSRSSRSSGSSGNSGSSKHRHNADEFHAIQTQIGYFLEMYWQWRGEHDHKPYAIYEFKQFMETDACKKFIATLGNVSRGKYHYHAGAADVFPEMRSRWGAGEPICGYVLTRYVDALKDAIEDPKSYSNGPSHEPVSPMYSIPCTAECLHLLAVSEKMMSHAREEERLKLYVDELDISSKEDPAGRWVLKHALAQLTAYNYGDALPVVGPSLKADLHSVKSRLRRIMACKDLLPGEAFLSRDGVSYTCTDPGCWSFLHEQYCVQTTPPFLFDPHWQIMAYNVMLPRLLDDIQHDLPADEKLDSEDRQFSIDQIKIIHANVNRYTTCVGAYQITISASGLNAYERHSLLYNYHEWPRRSPLVFNIAAHSSDNFYILDHICRELVARNVRIYEMKRSKDDCMLLHVAAASGNFSIVKNLLKYYRKNVVTDFARRVYWNDIINTFNGRTRLNAPSGPGLGETPRDVVENRLYNLVLDRGIETKDLSADEIIHLQARLSKVDKLMVNVFHAQNNKKSVDTMTRTKVEQTLAIALEPMEELPKHMQDKYVSNLQKLLGLLADDEGFVHQKR